MVIISQQVGNVVLSSIITRARNGGFLETDTRNKIFVARDCVGIRASLLSPIITHKKNLMR